METMQVPSPLSKDSKKSLIFIVSSVFCLSMAFERHLILTPLLSPSEKKSAAVKKINRKWL